MTAPENYRAAWEGKPILRLIYHDYYRRITARCKPGRTLEIGGGSGNLKAWLSGVVSTDIVSAPWLDVIADAHSLPFADASFDNIVMVDVLHHLSKPREFFIEASRLLRPSGRIVMVEPGITPVSWALFKLLHDEPVRMDIDALGDKPLSNAADPWDANQAIPTLIFNREPGRFEQCLPALRIAESSWLSLIAYPLSGGFKRWQLMPTAAARLLLRIEDLLMPVLGGLMAFRLLIVVERRAT